MVKTSPSNAGRMGSTPGQELRSHMPPGQTLKQCCNKSHNVFKNGPYQKAFKKKTQKRGGGGCPLLAWAGGRMQHWVWGEKRMN